MIKCANCNKTLFLIPKNYHSAMNHFCNKECKEAYIAPHALYQESCEPEIDKDHKLCKGPCGRVRHISEFHTTQTKRNGKVIKYKRGKCAMCRRAEIKKK